MDADTRTVLELLGPAVERAAQHRTGWPVLGAQQEALMQSQEASAQKFSSQIAMAIKREADSIVAAARAEEQAVRAKIAESEAEHAATLAEADRERAEAEAAHLERQRQREAEHEARVAMLQEQGLASVAKRERDFEAACA